MAVSCIRSEPRRRRGRNRRRRHGHHRTVRHRSPPGPSPPARKLRRAPTHQRHRSRQRSPPTSASPRTRSPSACSPTCPGPSLRWSARSSRPSRSTGTPSTRDGGIAGRQVELIIEDNAYDVPTQLEKYEVIRDDVAIISQSTGSPHYVGDRRRTRRGQPRRHPVELVLRMAGSRVRRRTSSRPTRRTASSR